ncbi:MAG: ABC transporter ATP-binding protein [Dethiobacter sp.]|nr:MAG: ABC transporter ATP-binding protein [Dethiobacter sp.]
MESVLKIKDLSVNFNSKDGIVKAANNLNLTIYSGEILGLIGETGSGKTVLGQAIIKILPQTARVTGEIWYGNRNILALGEEEMNKIRGKEIALIFQNPSSSLNPSLKIGEQIAETVQKHQGLNKKEAWEKAEAILSQVGMPPRFAHYYPHQYSGGMRQRAMVAICLACQPLFYIADEPTRGLDVTVQNQIAGLLNSIIKNGKGQRSMLLITHDISVAAALTDSMAIMYAGEIVEYGPTREVFKNPLHPYSKGLLNSHPAKGLKPIKGFSPSLINLPEGCKFFSRCSRAEKDCQKEVPMFGRKGGKHIVRCFYA